MLRLWRRWLYVCLARSGKLGIVALSIPSTFKFPQLEMHLQVALTNSYIYTIRFKKERFNCMMYREKKKKRQVLIYAIVTLALLSVIPIRC